MNWRKLLGLPDPKPSTEPMGETKCPGCDAWSYDVPSAWREETTPDGEMFVKRCSGCGHESRWIMGPGLMLCIDPKVQAAE